MLKFAPILLVVLLAGCNSGGSSSGPSGDTPPPGSDQSEQAKSCKEKRKAYVLKVMGDKKTVADLMEKALGEGHEQFWRDLPDCYRSAK